MVKNGKLSIWEVLSNGSELHQLLPAWNEPAGECCGNWSADGNYFAFQATRGGKTEVWATRERRRALDGLAKQYGEPVRLTTGQLNSLWRRCSTRTGTKLYVIGQQPRGEMVRYDLAHQLVTRFLRHICGVSGLTRRMVSGSLMLITLTALYGGAASMGAIG